MSAPGAEGPTTAPRADAGGPGARRLLIAAGVAFLLGGALLLSLGPRLRPDLPEVQRQPVRETAKPAEDGTFLVTLDVSSPRAWVGFALERGERVPAPEADLAARRNVLRARHGAVDLGRVPLQEAVVPESVAWRSDADLDRSSRTDVPGRWYAYGYLTHLLTSKGRVYAVRCASGAVAYVRVESYYCEPEGSGCLTLRYRLP